MAVRRCFCGRKRPSTVQPAKSNAVHFYSCGPDCKPGGKGVVRERTVLKTVRVSRMTSLTLHKLK